MLKLSVNGCLLTFFDQCQAHEAAIKKPCEYGAKTLVIAFPALLGTAWNIWLYKHWMNLILQRLLIFISV